MAAELEPKAVDLDKEALKVNASMLSYSEMTVVGTGGVMTKETKMALRKKLGYCLECLERPVQIFDIKRSRLNPLWLSKKTRNEEGECREGKCLRCHPDEVDTKASRGSRRGPRRRTSDKSVGTTSTASLGSSQSIKSEPESMVLHPVGTTPRAHSRSLRKTPSIKELDEASTHERSGAGRPESSEMRRRDPRRRRSSIGAAPNHEQRSYHDNSSLWDSHHSCFSQDSTTCSLRGSSSSDRLENDLAMDSRRSPRYKPRARRSSMTGGAMPERRLDDHRRSQGRQSRGRRASMSGATPSSEFRMNDPRRSPGHRRSSLSGVTPPYLTQNTIRRSTDNSYHMGDSHHSTRSHYSSYSMQSGRSTDMSERSFRSAESMERSERSHQSNDDYPIPQAQVHVNANRTTEELSALFADLASGGNFKILTEIISDSMKSHAADDEVLVLCLRTIANAFMQSDASIADGHRLHEDVLRAMVETPSSVDVQGMCCLAIWALARNEPTRTALVRKGVCEAVLKTAARFMDDRLLASRAFMALRALSIDEEARVILHKCYAAETTVRVMGHHAMNVDVQRDGCAILSNMAVEIDNKQPAPVSAGTLEAVVTALKTHLNDASVVQSACFALNNFSYHPKNLRALGRFSEIVFLLERSQHLCERGYPSLVLEKLQISRAEDESTEEQILQQIVQLLERKRDNPAVVCEIIEILNVNDWSLRILGESLASLRKVVMGSESHREVLLDRMPVSDLADYIKNHDDIRVQTEAHFLIKCYAT